MGDELKPAAKKPAAKKAATPKLALVKSAGAAAGAPAPAAATPFVLTPFSELQPWHRNARHELGVQEVKGAKHNARILEYHSVTTLRATTDEVPWCSSFIAWIMEQAGIRSTRSAAASSWLQWGHELTEPRLGCLVIFRRAGGHHVGIFEGWNNGRLMILGGNQSDSVRVSPYSTDTVLGYRWPDIFTKPK